MKRIIFSLIIASTAAASAASTVVTKKITFKCSDSWTYKFENQEAVTSTTKMMGTQEEWNKDELTYVSTSGQSTDDSGKIIFYYKALRTTKKTAISNDSYQLDSQIKQYSYSPTGDTLKSNDSVTLAVYKSVDGEETLIKSVYNGKEDTNLSAYKIVTIRPDSKTKIEKTVLTRPITETLENGTVMTTLKGESICTHTEK
jgi:hypothetical protein